MKNRAWVIDDHKLFNAGLSRLILTLDAINEVDSFDNPASALQQRVDEKDLSLIVADYFMPGFSIETWLPKLRRRFPQTPIVIISSSISRVDRAKCFKLKANAYYEKHSEPEDVLNGLQEILSHCHANTGLETLHSTDHNNDIITQSINNAELTNRQVDVLIYLARGHATKAIATEFKVSTETIKSHISQIYRKLGVSSREDACRWAREKGLV